MDLSVVKAHVAAMLSEGLGLDLSDPNLKDTPDRISKMYCREFFANIDPESKFENLRVFPNQEKYNQIIMLDRIHFVSMCSHHFLPFTGLAWVAYIPNKYLVGASKPSRLINFFSKKPQLQEGLSHEVLKTFNEEVKPQGTMVMIRGIHGCMSNRGVMQYGGSGMMTSAVSGCFMTDPAARSEALDLVKISLMVQTV
jgi:GTP cyclohydrolase I